jgi:hypothetical protein
VQRLQDVESKMREELHERLEGMVLDVEDVINASERADLQTETFETDELCVESFGLFPTFANCHAASSESSEVSSISTRCESCNSHLSCGRRISRSNHS